MVLATYITSVKRLGSSGRRRHHRPSPHVLACSAIPCTSASGPHWAVPPSLCGRRRAGAGGRGCPGDAALPRGAWLVSQGDWVVAWMTLLRRAHGRRQEDGGLDHLVVHQPHPDVLQLV